MNIKKKKQKTYQHQRNSKLEEKAFLDDFSKIKSPVSKVYISPQIDNY